MGKRIMTLNDIQNVNLDIMSDIHSFCENNGIHYSLAYGSLIGAIRHKGFIPWDDDIDIMMPRPDFERFSKEYRSKRGFHLSSVYDSDTYVNYTRVYDNKRTRVICPAKPSRKEIGVWVDVFPIDGIPDDVGLSNNQFSRLRHETQRIMLWRQDLSRIHYGSLGNRIKGCVHIIKLFLQNQSTIRSWHSHVLSICKEQTYGETERCSSLVCVEANKKNNQEVFQTSDFSSYILAPFENKLFYIVQSYDSVLTTIFGDYMKMPPKEKQISHINHSWKFFWYE